MSDIKRAIQAGVRFATEYSPSAIAYRAFMKSHGSVGNMDTSYSGPNTPTPKGGANDGVGGSRNKNPLSKNLNYGAKKTRQAANDREQYAGGGIVSYKSIFDLE